MSDRYVQIEKFASAIRQLKVLDRVGLEQFLSAANVASEQSLLEILSQVDRISPKHVDMVDVLARADDAIPGYQILDVIGVGGMGVVWRARQKSLDRTVALKTISAELQNNPQVVARFEREAVAIAKLSHPNIVTALDFGKHRNRLYLAMEIVNGQDLGGYIEQNGAIQEKLAWGIARQVAAGLAHASREGVIHRDIKPANLLMLKDSYSGVSPSGIPAIKITDFGLALLNASDLPLEARLTSTGAAIGSPHYMAPEQFTGALADMRTDIYALGATVFQMLTGEPPWHGKNLPQVMGDKLSGKQAPLDEAIVKVSPQTMSLLRRMMASDIDLRPEHCSQLLTEIDGVLAEIGNVSRITAARLLGKSQQPPASSNSLNEDDTSEFQVVDLDGPVSSDVGSKVAARVGAKSVATRELLTVSGGGEQESKTDQRKFKYARFAVFASVLFVGLVVLISFWPFASAWRPISLELEKNSGAAATQFLFDGENPFRSPYHTHNGSWIEQQGWLVADPSSPRNWINYQLPEWTYFKVEMIVRTDKSNLIDVAFGGVDTGKSGPQYSLRFVNGQAQLGTLAKIYGDFKPIGQPLDLIAGRDEHFVEIQKNHGGWLIQLYRQDDFTRTLAFLDGRDPANELTLISQKTSSAALTAGENLDSAFSEINILQMKPAD
jgi:serine/threonine protein kinase